MKALRLLFLLVVSLFFLSSLADAESVSTHNDLSYESQAKHSLVESATTIIEERRQQESIHHLRRRRRRRLPGEYDFDFGNADLASAEAGFAVGFLFFLLLICLLCCCLCGGGRSRGCSLWDILACVCIYELCCDGPGGGINDFAMMPA